MKTLMRLLALAAAFLLTAQIGGMAMRGPEDCNPMLRPKPEYSTEPTYGAHAFDPRNPGYRERWRFRLACAPPWRWVEGWPTEATCIAGRARFVAKNNDPDYYWKVTGCEYYDGIP